MARPPKKIAPRALRTSNPATRREVRNTQQLGVHNRVAGWASDAARKISYGVAGIAIGATLTIAHDAIDANLRVGQAQQAAAEARADAKLQHELRARDAVAGRFAGCTVVGVEAVGPNVPADIARHGGRNRLLVRIAVTKDPNAAWAEKQYVNDDAVQWLSSVRPAAGYLPPGSPAHIHRGTPIGTDRDYYFGESTASKTVRPEVAATDPTRAIVAGVYPRAAYVTGTTVDVSLATGVTVHDQAGRALTTIGVEHCGAIEKVAPRDWRVMSPGAPN